MKKLHILIITAATLLLAALIAVCVYIQDKSSILTVRIVCPAEDGAVEAVSVFQDGDRYCAFLPSYCDLKRLSLEYGSGYSLYLDETYVGSGSDCPELTAGKTYSVTMKNSLGLTLCREKLEVMKAENVASLSIHLSDGSIKDINDNQNVTKSGSMSLITADKTVNYAGYMKGLHGRGNSGWAQNKKSYTLQLPEASDLLGMGKGETWVLISNTFDESNLKNKLAYDAAKKLGVKYAVDSEYVDLYIDGVYYGLYLLAERVEVGENRVEITDLQEKTQSVNRAALKNFYQYTQEEDGKTKKGYLIPNDPDDITGGYLLQLEHHADQLEKEESLFHTQDLSFVISSPKYASNNQVDYIADVCRKVESDLRNGDLSGVDLDSFVNYCIAHELFYSGDKSSCYYFKDIDAADGRICAGPIWDFDQSFGASWLRYSTEPHGLCYDDSNWFDLLYADAAFRDRLTERFESTVLPDVVPFVRGKIREYADAIGASYQMNARRWKDREDLNSGAYRSQIHLGSLQEHVDYLLAFFDRIVLMLKKEWSNDSEVCRLTFSSELSGTDEAYYRNRGEAMGLTPDAANNKTRGFRFLGWYDADGVRFDESAPAQGDIQYAARWEKADGADSSGAPQAGEQSGLSEGDAGHHDAKWLLQYGGAAVIAVAIVAFVAADILRCIKSRRRRHDRKR